MARDIEETQTCPYCGYIHQPGEATYYVELDETGGRYLVCKECGKSSHV